MSQDQHHNIKKLIVFFFLFLTLASFIHFIIVWAVQMQHTGYRLNPASKEFSKGGLYIQQWSPPIKSKQSKSCFPYVKWVNHAIKFGGETNSNWSENFASTQQKCKGYGNFEQFWILEVSLLMDGFIGIPQFCINWPRIQTEIRYMITHFVGDLLPTL